MAKAAKPDKQVIINSIIKKIEQGKSKAKAWAGSGGKWQISLRTFERFWKIANEQFAELQEKAKHAADEAYILASAEAAKKLVMSSQERKEVLSAIARGEIPLTKPMVVDGSIELVPVVPNWMDRKAAIAELNKMEGDYAPTKIASTDIEGNNITHKTYIEIVPPPVIDED